MSPNSSPEPRTPNPEPEPTNLNSNHEPRTTNHELRNPNRQSLPAVHAEPRSYVALASLYQFTNLPRGRAAVVDDEVGVRRRHARVVRLSHPSIPPCRRARRPTMGCRRGPRRGRDPGSEKCSPALAESSGCVRLRKASDSRAVARNAIGVAGGDNEVGRHDDFARAVQPAVVVTELHLCCRYVDDLPVNRSPPSRSQSIR